MRKNIFRKWLLVGGISALTIVSCEEDSSNSSVITSFQDFPVTGPAAPIVVSEDDAGVYAFDFAVDDKQITDMHITVGVGSSSTATEGVDFELVTHDVDLDALAGQDGFVVEVEVLEDFLVDDGDETIYLTFTSETPSGLVSTETQVITIEDNGALAPLTIDMSWDYEFEFGGDTYTLCDFMDVDIFLYNEDGDPVAVAATANCPESMELAADSPNGVYEIWVNYWDRYPFEDELCEDGYGNEYQCLGPFDVPGAFTFTRGDVVETITYDSLTNSSSVAWRLVDGVSANPYIEYYVGAVELVDGAFTLIDIEGDSFATMRKRVKTQGNGVDKPVRKWTGL
ncbi:MAG TPA: hypothetical protein VGK59_12870 [Ohtaekwangia sp.]